MTAGTAEAVVVETGDRTELGRISGLLGGVEDTQTPLTRSIGRLGAAVTKVIGVVAVVLLAVALLRGYPVADAVLAAITLAVAAIPEGLPAIVTIALAVGVQRMARRRAVVRELPAVETLGSTSVICTDKTGTLTRNETVVRRAWVPGGVEVEFDGVGYTPGGRMRVRGGPAGAMRELLEAGALANEAHLDGDGVERTVLGDPTDGALLVAAERGGVDLGALFRNRPPHAVLPFDSQRQYMASTPAPGSAGPVATYLKGAPEVLLAHVEPAVAAMAHAALARYAANGLRVLAVARTAGVATDDALLGAGLELLGLVALIDPPRPGVVEAVDECHRAGIRVKMITGDHAATAAAIARDLGIVGASPPMTGTEIVRSEEELRERVQATDVFARVAPEHKLRLVRALQAGGAVTAMTGDGVNDAPALRQADIGVAMGRAGTAAAKEAADIVLGDDDFGTIRAAVEEGRRVYDNLVKALAFALPTNAGEALVILVAVLAFPVVGGVPVLPIEPVQILWINLVATVSLALPIAFEALEPGAMARPPRRPDEPLLSRFVVARTIYVGALMAAVAIALFLLTRGGAGADVAQAQTLAVTSLAFFQIFYLLMCRTRRCARSGGPRTAGSSLGSRSCWSCRQAWCTCRSCRRCSALQTSPRAVAAGRRRGRGRRAGRRAREVVVAPPGGPSRRRGGTFGLSRPGGRPAGLNSYQRVLVPSMRRPVAHTAAFASRALPTSARPPHDPAARGRLLGEVSDLLSAVSTSLTEAARCLKSRYRARPGVTEVTSGSVRVM